jgi:hypothetical protein
MPQVASQRSPKKWFNISTKIFLARFWRQELQYRNSTLKVSVSLMNDFPTREDPPVTTTASFDFITSPSEGFTAPSGFLPFTGPTPRSASVQTKTYAGL